MLKLEKGYYLSVKSVEDDQTKDGIPFLKCKGTLMLKVYTFGKEKSFLSRQYFSKIMLFGTSEYLDEVKKRVYALGTEECKDTAVKIELNEAYVNNSYLAARRSIFTSLIIAQSNFFKKKMKFKFADKAQIGDYYLSPAKEMGLVVEKPTKVSSKKVVKTEPVKPVEVETPQVEEKPKEQVTSLLDAYFNNL